MAKHDLDAWLNLLSDEERAGVMKVQITEAETTKRAQIEAEASVRKKMIDCDGYHVVRALWAGVAMLSVAGIIGVGYQGVEVWGRTHAAPVTSASAAPALTVPK